MGHYNGKMGKGASKHVKAAKSADAFVRSQDVPCERTRAHRLGRTQVTKAQRQSGMKACTCQQTDSAA